MARVLFNLAVSAATLAIATLSALPSVAAGLTWTLNNTVFNDGVGASGRFDYDGQNFSNINIQTIPGYTQGGHYTDSRLLSPETLVLSSNTLKPYEYGKGECCQLEILFSSPLSAFSNLFADDVPGGIVSVDFQASEYGDLIAYYEQGPSAWRIVPVDRVGFGTVTTTLPTRPTPVPEPSMILGSVVGGAAIIVLRRKRTKSNQAEP